MAQKFNLNDFLEKSNELDIQTIPNGFATTMEEFYDKVVSLNLPKKETVEKWHDLLMKYIKDDEAIFFIRRYATAPNKNWKLIRRGFLTEYNDGVKYVYCDNYFAHYFYMMAVKDIVPTYDEFKSTIIGKKFPYGFMVTSEEKPFQAFKNGKSVNINKAGWKLDHINSVNSDYSFDYKSEKNQIFPIGKQEDWIDHEGKGYVSRILPSSEIINHKEKVIAHFLRLAHPMNYFLTHQRKMTDFDAGGFRGVIDLVRDKYKIIYGKKFEDFERLIYINESRKTKNDKFPDVVNFGYNVKKKLKDTTGENQEKESKRTNKIDSNEKDNKKFVFSMLQKLVDKPKVDFLNILTDENNCKKHFNLAFPLLKKYNSEKVTDKNKSEKDRYYSNKTLFNYNGSNYIVCNHWFSLQRELFENWVNKI